MAFSSESSYSQSENIYEEMSWEELSDIELAVTATKRPEDLFEAPLSITIIKKEQIINSGANSIPEALRLAPGLIVRETTPGNFDVHIRGFDDITRSFISPLPMNTIILVMINNRPTYSYFLGGTFWDALPVDINDIKQIEIVRGPASALYGPNAVAGVINIITEHSTEEGFNSNLRMVRGTNNQGYLNGSIGYNNGSDFKATLSANLASTTRYDSDYYSWNQQRYITADSMKRIIQMYSDVEKTNNSESDNDKSLTKFASNLFVQYKYNDDINFDISLGASGSEAQKIYMNNFTTPLSNCKSEASYIDVKSSIYGFNLQLFAESGDYETDFAYNKHSYDNGIINLDYLFDLDKFKIRPSVGITSAIYDNAPLLSGSMLGQVTSEAANVERQIRTFNLSLFTEYQPYSQLRFIVGGRADYYEFNKKTAYSYEFATTYRHNKDNLFRFDVAQSTRSPFIIETYMDVNVWGMAILRKPESTISDTVPFITQYSGNKDLDFISQLNTEIGWRRKLTSKIEIDMEFFFAHITDMTAMINEMELVFDEEEQKPSYVLNKMQYKNIKNVDAHQLGFNLSVIYNPIEDISIRVYGMWQKTNLEIDNAGEEYREQIRWENKSTPTLTLGTELNWKFAENWNFNANYYYMSKQEFAGLTNNELGYGGLEKTKPYYDTINSTNVLNFTVRGKVYGDIWLSGSARNILQKAKQYGFTDNIGASYLIGIEIK